MLNSWVIQILPKLILTLLSFDLPFAVDLAVAVLFHVSSLDKSGVLVHTGSRGQGQAAYGPTPWPPST